MEVSIAHAKTSLGHRHTIPISANHRKIPHSIRSNNTVIPRMSSAQTERLRLRPRNQRLFRGDMSYSDSIIGSQTTDGDALLPATSGFLNPLTFSTLVHTRPPFFRGNSWVRGLCFALVAVFAYCVFSFVRVLLYARYRR